MGLAWTPEAKTKLKRVPFFVRPLVKMRAESAAKARGERQVTASLLEELRKRRHG